jgi:hypothetical protein
MHFVLLVVAWLDTVWSNEVYFSMVLGFSCQGTSLVGTCHAGRRVISKRPPKTERQTQALVLLHQIRLRKRLPFVNLTEPYGSEVIAPALV